MNDVFAQPQDIRQDHMISFKQIFSFPRGVQDLFQRSMPEEWVKDMDFNTIKQVNLEPFEENDELYDTEAIWQIDQNGERWFLVCVIESEETMPKFWPLKLLTLERWVLLTIVEEENIGMEDPLPPVIELVFYSGKKPWDRPLSSEEYEDPELPSDLMQYQMIRNYTVINIHHLITA